MTIRKLVCFRLVTVALVTALSGPNLLSSQDTEPVSSRILKWSAADQVAWINLYIAEGMPPGDALAMLVLNRSSLTLPVLEKKIEEILHSEAPRELFSKSSVDPQRVVVLAAAAIAYAGDEQALREEIKLIKIDEQRFGGLIEDTLFHALVRGNPFAVAYRGFAIGDPMADKRIAAWAEKLLSAKGKEDRMDFRRRWAEVMAETYGGVPTTIQWATDPIVSRLNTPVDSSLYGEMVRYTQEAVEKRRKK